VYDYTYSLAYSQAYSLGGRTNVRAEEAIQKAFVEVTVLGERYLDDLADALSPGLRRGTAQPLLRLHRDGPERVSVLARALGLDSTTVTRHLDELERRGLVTRTQDATDGRASVVRLTAMALAQLDAAQAERRRRLRDVMAGWPAQERSEFARLFGRFVEDAAHDSALTSGARSG
jgi:DNA-binding MarR family transcriptional regulator